MSNEEYKKQIAQMLENINDETILRRIYLVLTVIVGG